MGHGTFIVTVILCWPYWIIEIYANFASFNNISQTFIRLSSRRDLLSRSSEPWLVFTTISLCYTIKREYNFRLWELVLVSPRFGVMLASMCLSIAFIVVDTCSVLEVFSDSLPTGMGPFWKDIL
ncbi:hypothetical protein N7492_005696 [Penicillium capsulatum]|uniref:Uncharacterized protein n=1 Tax=Penicillium capsulatum TaxID=69766 RepID=A0A9W9ICG0_9EURO|nr:hypothetical protein N7492_005696 [Penicillium capsulatum]KAJ6135206.1 hypothetical protein N7512_000366 [Penicillium capsulatum]